MPRVHEQLFALLRGPPQITKLRDAVTESWAAVHASARLRRLILTRRGFNSNQARKLAIAVLNAADLPPDGSPGPDIDEPMPPGGNDWQTIVHLTRQLVKSAPATPDERPKQRVFVTVQGGVSAVCEDTVPTDVEVEILDFDNLAGDAESEICHWSPGLKDYWLMNRRAWERCEANCPYKKWRGEYQSRKDAL